jgi:myo-inositol-1(or 4)-monophosphatase
MDEAGRPGVRLGCTMAEHDRLLEVAVEAARAAGAILLPRFGSEKVLATKSTDTDLVSEADLAAERAIRELLAERFPEDAVMGEEGDDTPGSSGRRWIVDPLDGTVNYLYGIPMWCVSVACEDLVGVIFDPVRGELFTAVAGEGAQLNGAPLAPGVPDGLGQALVATGFGYAKERRVLQAEVAARVLPEVRDIRRAGAAALDLAWCAAGRVDAYWERGVNPWDVAAGELICREAGRDVRRLEPSGDLPWGTLVAPPQIADELFGLVAWNS